MRIGIYGGSFDPVHYGHLLLAESCREQCALDKVFFVPAATSPHKRRLVTSAGKDRAEMLRLAIGGHPQCEVQTWELDRGGVSYTVETMREVKEKFPGAQRFLLMGADSLLEFPSWRDPDQICLLASIVVVDRPGNPPISFQPIRALLGQSQSEEFQGMQVEMPRIDISSSDIRERVRTGRSIRYRTPRSVEAYIAAQGLYRGDRGD